MWGSKINTLTVHGSQSALVNRSNIILILLIAHWIEACEQIKCVFSYHVLIPMVLWLMDDFLILKQCQPRASWRLHSARDLLLCFGARGGGLCSTSLARCISKSILALQALDNLENIIQNSPFSMYPPSRVFSSKSQHNASVTQECIDKVKKKERKSAFMFSFSLSKHLLVLAYVYASLWIFFRESKLWCLMVLFHI